jgi:hypothetical protein
VHTHVIRIRVFLKICRVLDLHLYLHVEGSMLRLIGVTKGSRFSTVYQTVVQLISAGVSVLDRYELSDGPKEAIQLPWATA